MLNNSTVHKSCGLLWIDYDAAINRLETIFISQNLQQNIYICFIKSLLVSVYVSQTITSCWKPNMLQYFNQCYLTMNGQQILLMEIFSFIQVLFDFTIHWQKTLQSHHFTLIKYLNLLPKISRTYHFLNRKKLLVKIRAVTNWYFTLNFVVWYTCKR